MGPIDSWQGFARSYEACRTLLGLLVAQRCRTVARSLPPAVRALSSFCVFSSLSFFSLFLVLLQANLSEISETASQIVQRPAGCERHLSKAETF